MYVYRYVCRYVCVHVYTHEVYAVLGSLPHLASRPIGVIAADNAVARPSVRGRLSLGATLPTGSM